MNNAQLDTITINGVTYIRQDDQKEEGTPVVVCGGKTGAAVLIGYTKEPLKAGEPYTLHNARMLLYWPSACGGLLGFVQNGPKEGTRLSGVVDEVTDAVAHQWMPLSAKVAKAIAKWPVYRG